MFSPDDIASQNFELKNPSPSVRLDWSSKESISARASIVGERLSLKSRESFKPLATNPSKPPWYSRQVLAHSGGEGDRR
jgi:required for meiotic nuclear division protein 1